MIDHVVAYMGKVRIEMKKIIGGDIHLDGANVNRWIEISQEMLDEYFTEVVV